MVARSAGVVVRGGRLAWWRRGRRGEPAGVEVDGRGGKCADGWGVLSFTHKFFSTKRFV